MTNLALRTGGVDRPGPDVAVVARDHATLTAVRAEHILLALNVLPRNWRFHEMYARMQRYAASGIEHYWLVDPHFDTGTVLTQYRRGPNGRYEPVQDADGIFTTDVPYPVTIDLPELTARATEPPVR